MIHAFGATATTAVPSSTLVRYKLYQNERLQKSFKLNATTIFQKRPGSPPNLILARAHKTTKSNLITEAEEASSIKREFQNEEIVEQHDEDEGCPWEGAIIYKRDPSISHLEYCTTLERLGLGKLSSEVSKSRASEMGIRVTKSVKDYPNGTPVLVSIDVTRKKGKMRLDGIIRTVISLGCNRCGEPAAESVYSDLSILLSEEPIQEPETINMGVIFGEDKFKSFGMSEEDESDNDALIDPEDHLYFPPEEKFIDISKNIRDLVHIEITIKAVCNPSCKGLCLKCGTNLNISNCNCRTNEVEEKGYGPLGARLFLFIPVLSGLFVPQPPRGDLLKPWEHLEQCTCSRRNGNHDIEGWTPNFLTRLEMHVLFTLQKLNLLD
ncbi:unnamed protein product [Fraxinus pennsylvanica]|uniref:Large ribosomal RNA subunit accumulation protein YCED homolog 1, chloroplastic n=1 Tax=Fraxinus pennsylvanica TaxID=56036 RepID=A0AAD1ZUR4_9LAMI|nr:unnamed protein product [Fraxinus pennsylvanica]